MVTNREVNYRREDIIQDFNKKKTTLHGKYHQQIKDLDTTHETWIGNFSSQHKKKLKICQELYKVDQHKIDKTEYSTDELQAYAIYKLAVDTYKNTKEKVSERYTKYLEVLNLELDKISKEINKNLQEREAVADETRREEQLLVMYSGHCILCLLAIYNYAVDIVSLWCQIARASVTVVV